MEKPTEILPVAVTATSSEETAPTSLQVEKTIQQVESSLNLDFSFMHEAARPLSEEAPKHLSVNSSTNKSTATISEKLVKRPSQISYISRKSNTLDKNFPVQEPPTKYIPGKKDSLSEAENWTPEEEAAMVKKVDYRVLSFLSIVFLFSYLVRVNMGNGKIANKETNETLLDSLNLTMEQFALCTSFFFVPYVLFQIPSNMVLKSVSPSRFMATIIFVWGVVATFSAFLTEFNGFLITRIILGIAQSGFVAGSVYYLSLWYKPKEQGLRLFLYFSTSTITGVIGGFLGYLISFMNNVGGLKGWQWIFIIEGFPSIILAVLCLRVLPDVPSEAYFFTPKERYIAANRIKVIEESSTFNMRECLVGLFHPRTIVFGIMNFCRSCPSYSFSFLLPTICFNLGYDSLTSQLMSSPPYIIGYIFSIWFAWHSDRTERKFHLVFIFTGLIVCFILMNVLSGIPKYIVINFCVGLTIPGLPISIAWHNEILGTASRTTKAVTSAMIISLTNMGGVLSPVIYSTERFGNFVNAGLGGLGLSCVLFVYIYVRFFKTPAALVSEKVSIEKTV